MSETIPEEVMIAAQDMVDTLSCTDDRGHEWQLAIARALLARDERAAKEEREACAKIATELVYTVAYSKDGTIRNSPVDPEGRIASAIRDRSKT